MKPSNELMSKMRQMCVSAMDFSQQWEEEFEGDELSEGYPFGDPFQDQLYYIVRWYLLNYQAEFIVDGIGEPVDLKTIIVRSQTLSTPFNQGEIWGLTTIAVGESIELHGHGTLSGLTISYKRVS